MSRATVDLQSVRFFLGYGLIFILQNLLTILLAAVVMFVLQPSLAAITLAPVPLVMLAAARYGRQSRPALQEVQQRIAELTAEAEESISGIRVVKAFAREHERRERFRDRVGRVFDQSMYSTRLRAFYNPMISFLPNLGLAAVLLVGGRQVVNGSITLGEFVTFNTYLLMLMFPMRMLGHRARHGAARGRVGQPRVRDPRPRAAASGAARPAAAAAGRRADPGSTHATLSYDGGPPALDDVTLDVAPGETRRDRRPDRLGQDDAGGRGRAPLRPHRRVDLDRRRRRARARPRATCAVRSRWCPTTASCSPPRCGRTSPTRARTRRWRRCELAARRAQIHAFIESLPDGYDTLVGERGLTLSGGQRQRIAIARALIADPRVLVLDDATASVDATTEREIKRALREVMEGRTTFVIAHRLSTIALADRIVVMEGGRVTALGTHEELLDAQPALRGDRRQGHAAPRRARSAGSTAASPTRTPRPWRRGHERPSAHAPAAAAGGQLRARARCGA